MRKPIKNLLKKRTLPLFLEEVFFNVSNTFYYLHRVNLFKSKNSKKLLTITL